MNAPLDEEPSAPNGEVSGSVLIGLVRALNRVQVLSGDNAAHLVEGIESTHWYPMANFFKVLDEIRKWDVDVAPILFRAGKVFIEDWYCNCGGNAVVSNVLDFLRLQASNGGYSSVHRGNPEDIGWQELLELNQTEGRAVIVCINPYPLDFERGLFYGGAMLAGDVQFAAVEAVEEPYNRYLKKKTLTVRFHLNPAAEDDHLLDALLSAMAPGKPVSFPERLNTVLAWRFKALDQQYRAEAQFWQQSNSLLSKASDAVYEMSKKLDHLAHEDYLTEVYNRRAIFERLGSLAVLAARNKWALSCIMIDVDNFKAINDTWGHKVGDGVLHRIAFILKERLRASDLLGRLGVEEFLIALPQTGLADAGIIAENLRSAVELCPLFTDGKQRIPVTISLGLADLCEAQYDLETCIAHADQALYQAKRDGRNRLKNVFAHYTIKFRIYPLRQAFGLCRRLGYWVPTALASAPIAQPGSGRCQPKLNILRMLL